MASPEEILAEARRWLDTPFRHQGRCLGVGVDCIGLIVGVARGLGLEARDRTDYPRQPDGVHLEAALDTQLRRLAPGRTRPGDVLLMRIRRLPQHVGILAEHGTLIHAHSAAGRVVEMRLDERWWDRVVAAYRFPGA
jgi:NlpC/P60 family putative phage cell wall peptidase